MGFETAIAAIEEACGAGRIPGAVLGTITLDGATRMQATGYARLVPEKAKMRVETWFDLAWLTKVIFTTERILGHTAVGRIDLDAPLVSVLPDLRQYDLSA